MCLFWKNLIFHEEGYIAFNFVQIYRVSARKDWFINICTTKHINTRIWIFQVSIYYFSHFFIIILSHCSFDFQHNQRQEYFCHQIINSFLLNPSKSGLSQWFLNLLSNQAKHAKLACLAWFDGIVKNYQLLTTVIGNHFNQGDKTKIAMNISKKLVSTTQKLVQAGKG